MATLITTLLSLRRDPRLLKLPPYLSALLIVIGLGWLLLLPLNEYSRRTYISENALLPGQVHTYFGGSEHNVFRAFRQEVAALAGKNIPERTEGLLDILETSGLKSAVQDFHFSKAGQWKNGTNVYGVIQGPRADATEAMVLIAAWQNMEDAINYSGVALTLTLARYFKRWSLWSKDIIVVITPDSTFGPQAWVDAYHEAHDTAAVAPLTIKSGALQGAVAIDYPAGPWGQRFDKLHVHYDGVNGQLPNLDLINTAINIAKNQHGIECTLQQMYDHDDGYEQRLRTLLRGMVKQAVGHSSGPHSSFMRYHIDAITLQAVGNDGWHDEISFGKTVEGLFRSVNNLLEHLHQSFFFYLLMQSHRFVSIGTYLPSAMLIAGSFTITAILLWFLSGRPALEVPHDKTAEPSPLDRTVEVATIKSATSTAIIAKQELQVAERELMWPLTLVSAAHAVGLVPLFALSITPQGQLEDVGKALGTISALAPIATAVLISRWVTLSHQQLMVIQCMSLLVLGAALATLATINFAQALFVGLAASPLSFVRPLPSSISPAARIQLTLLAIVALSALSPMALIVAGSRYFGIQYKDVLNAAAWAWEVENVWTAVTVWLVWWPAWSCGVFVLASGTLPGRRPSKDCT